MLNAECGTSGVLLSEAKHLNRENRPFASLRVTVVAFRIHHSAFIIPFARRSVEVPKVEAKVRKAIRAALRRHGVVRARISVALVNDATMAQLNRDHLGHNGPTDVLCFDLRDEASEKNTIDGEIVMSVDMAVKQARERGHAVEAELALYAVHGTLHLLGYDDRRKADAAHMHEMEDEILSSIGFGAVYAAKELRITNYKLQKKRRIHKPVL